MPTVRPAIRSPVSHPKSAKCEQFAGLGDDERTVSGDPGGDGEETDQIGDKLFVVRQGNGERIVDLRRWSGSSQSRPPIRARRRRERVHLRRGIR